MSALGFVAFGDTVGPSADPPGQESVLIPPTISAQRLAPPAHPALAPEPVVAQTDAPVEDPVAAEIADPEPLPTMTVRAGDTLGSLAEWFGLTTYDLAAFNGISLEDYLVIGQVLTIPVPAGEFVLPPENFVAVEEEPEPAAPVPAAVALAVVTPAPRPAPPAPTPVPTPAPAPPRQSDVVAAICSFPWPCDQMVRIAQCESGLNPRAVNPAGYYGLFQIDHQFAGWDDPLENSRYAYERKYLPAQAAGDALAPWPACRYR